MKIVLLSTFGKQGGAAVACQRISESLNKNNGIEAKLLVLHKNSENNSVVKVKSNKYSNFIRFAFERLVFWKHERSKSVRFAFSLSNTGLDISENQLIKEADIINIHWINQGYLSLKNIEQLLNLNKPIVWTLHDMWAFTGGCHYAGDCLNFQKTCGNCHFLKNPKESDLSKKTYHKKLKIFKNKKITVVTCSKWLGDVAKSSSLFKDFRVESIKNPINTEIFKPIGKQKALQNLNIVSNKKTILFGAMNVGDKRKGFEYLKKALFQLSENKPDTKNEIEILIFGKQKEEIELPFPQKNLSFIKNINDIISVYNAADVLVIPSLEDNLPNTISESHACGTPVVGYNTGGIKEMIEHKKNGYLAKYKSTEDLAEGIYWVLFQTDNSIKKHARQKAIINYSEETISKTYLKLYDELIN